ncbi:sulfatase family protein [Calycomorphotria hydatis]|uniref:Arylsulfatase n=1 Tax=Calycomorphotria hydatis TaxID=2528027 RepID=A0A517TEA2_9PLAN|nr:sulfatase [Calycomorphotria hydatis]QDT66696.1 Arylsulfatase [Calycomorphotria hydatis]
MIRCCLPALACIVLCTSTSFAAAKNVVVVVVDDMGFQAGCYGNDVIQTPNLDQLAAEGTKFTRAHCTSASCSASRSVILTGLYNHATGHYGHAHSYNHFSTYETVPTLPVMLEEAGYRTCSVGKYHVAPNYIYKFQDYRNKNTQGHRNSVRMAENAIGWLKEVGDDPFFLYFCTNDPHRGGGEDGFSNFNDDPDRYPEIKRMTYSPDDVIVPDWMPETPESRGELAEYYQAISRLDQGLGKLVGALKEMGKYDDTLIMFLSDNGPPFPGAKTNLYEPGSHLPLIVRDPYQKEQGVTSDARVCWADLTPTILDWCGVKPGPRPAIKTVESVGEPTVNGRKVPVKFHGKSFLEAIDGDYDAEKFDRLYLSHTFHEITMYYPMRVIYDGNYKLIFNIAHGLPYPYASDLFKSPTWQGMLDRGLDHYGKRLIRDYTFRDRFELYDLKSDPDEIKNLARDPRHTDKLEYLQSELQNWQKETKDPWELKWRYE